MSFRSEFKEFALKGNVIDLAVGVIIGSTFGKIVESVVNDLIMPIIGRILGNINFSDLFIALKPVPIDIPMTLEAVKKAGVPVLAYGNFVTVALNFFILALVIFFMVKMINRIRQTPLPAPTVAAIPSEEVVLLRQIRDIIATK